MTYPLSMDNLMRTDKPQDWAFENISATIGLLKTSHLALENFGAGRFTDDEARHAVTYALEAALGLLTVAEEGVELLQRASGTGHWLNADSPIALMHKEITSLQAVAHEPGTPEAEGDAATDRMMELADKIGRLPAQNAHDMLLKIMGSTVNGDHEVGDGPEGKQMWAEARRIVGA